MPSVISPGPGCPACGAPIDLQGPRRSGSRLLVMCAFCGHYYAIEDDERPREPDRDEEEDRDDQVR